MPTALKPHLGLHASVTTLPRVGPGVAAKLAHLGITTIRDLVFYWPRTWLDMSAITPIKSVPADQFALIRGRLHGIALEQRLGKRSVRVSATITDQAGDELAVLWFNQAYLAHTLVEGKEYLLAGTVRWDWHRKRWYLASPTREHQLGVVAIYPETEGLTSRYLRGLIAPLLPQLDLPDPLLPASSTFEETAPTADTSKEIPAGKMSSTVLSLTNAVRTIHQPTTIAAALTAKARLAYDEHLLLQLGLAEQRQTTWQLAAPVIEPSIEAVRRLVASLPFTLTDAQRRAAWDLMQPLRANHQTQQLLQGDVGSGKTVVALLVALSVLEAGYHVTWLVPTQLLARQLHDRITAMLSKTKRRSILVMQGEAAAIPSQPTLFVGTHALLSRGPNRAGSTSKVLSDSSEVREARPIGLVVIDEQQRFGVAQREAAGNSQQALQPHVLTMTATPIPRSLALALLDEQSLVTLRGKPIHQRPVITRRVSSRSEVFDHLAAATQRGEQAFVVVPRISGVTDQLFDQSIDQVAAAYQRALPGAEIGVLHGQQETDEQALVLSRFANGEVAVVVATTVVEVGVDVPSATVMIIEQAEHFGLAQLHQLRGRVGRGTAQGSCYLVSDVGDEQATARLDALLETNDGFVLAQKDLELRGPGELLGTLQSGLPQLKLASLDDTLAVQQARRQVAQWLADPPSQLEAWRRLYGENGDFPLS